MRFIILDSVVQTSEDFSLQPWLSYQGLYPIVAIRLMSSLSPLLVPGY